MIGIQCSCGKQLSIPATIQSPQIRCPGCGGIFDNPHAAQRVARFPEPLPPSNQAYSPNWHQRPHSFQLPTGLIVAIASVGSGMLLLGLIFVVGIWTLRSLNREQLPVEKQSAVDVGDVPDLEVTLRKFRASGVPTNHAELEAAYRPQPEVDKTAEWLQIVAQVQKLDLKDRSKFLMNNQYGHVVAEIGPGMKYLLERIVNDNQRVVESAKKLTNAPFSVRYPLHAQPSEADKFPEVRNAEKVARLLLCDAYRQAFSGDRAMAMKRLVACMRIAGTIEPYPNDLAQIFRYSIISNTSNAVVSLLESKEVDESRLLELDREFQKVLQSNNAKSCLSGNLVVGLAGYEDPEGTLRYLQGVSLEDGMDYPSLIANANRNVEADRAYFAARMYTRLESLQDRAKLKQLASDELRVANTGSFPLAFLSLHPLDKTSGFRNATLHSAEAARTVIAIERFRLAANYFPESLEQLVPEYLDSVPVDHFSGAPLQYERNTDGYSLFSSAEKEVGRDESWQYFPPLKLRTTFKVKAPLSGSPVAGGSTQSAPPFPGNRSNLTPINGAEQLLREAEQRIRETEARQMQLQREAAERSGQ